MSSAMSAEEDRQLFIITCCVVSASALLVYEYLTTFDREYQLVWKRPFSAATLVFLLARYPILLVNILELPTIYPLSTTSCSTLTWLATALQLLSISVEAAFSSLRVYALSGRRWHVASLVFILSLVTPGVALFGDVQQVVVVAPPPINCTAVNLVSPELTNTLAYVERATAITADVLVLAVTVRQTYWTRRGAAEANLRTSLHTMILRDGTIYFLVLLILNIADIILIYLGDTFESGSYISEFINPITVIVISRFMFNLREVDTPQHSSEGPSHSSFVHSIRFAAFVEPLGTALDHEFSFSAIDPRHSDEQGVDSKPENVLGDDEERKSNQDGVYELSEVAESGPSSGSKL